MLTEEALILLGTLIASGFLVLGTANVLWPPRPRHLRRAAPVGLRSERSFEVATADGVIEEPHAEPPAFVEPAAPDDAAEPEPVELPDPEPIFPEPIVAAIEVPGGDDAPARVDEPPAAPAERRDPVAVLEDCRSLARAERFRDAVREATRVLDEPGRADRSTAALLWREVALARAAIGERDGALAAFRNAVDTAPDAERAAMRGALAGWAAQTARGMIAAAEEGARFTALHDARTLLEEAVATAGAHPDIAEVAAALEPEYWPEYEAHMHALMAGRDFGEAYRLATEALSDTDLPAERRPAFEDFRAETLTARIVSLIERAVVAMDEHREWEAVGALERAETLYRSATTLSADRRDEVARRLADGYAQLGRRRVYGGEFEDAVDPLFRALRIGPPNDENRDDARWALVQAIQGVVDTRVAMIREVASAGGRDSAMVQADKLWALLRSGMAAGVPQESMSAALATTRQLIEELGGNT